MSNPSSEARAMTLWESIAAWQRAGRPRLPASSDRAAARSVVDRWSKIVFGGDRALFEARLSWDDLDEDSVVEALSWVAHDSETAATQGPEYGWRETLDAAFANGFAIIDDEWTARFRRWANQENIPFVELWAPWVVDAAVDLRQHDLIRGGGFSDQGFDALIAYLLRQISDLGSPAVFEQFSLQRSARVSVLDESTGGRFYDSWLSDQITSGAASLFDEYPVLARQLFLLLRTWRESTFEMLDRFERDREAIGKLLPGDQNPGVVIEVRCGLSDRHHGGRRVVVLVFDGGTRVVYKPRSLTVECAFGDFLGWMVENGLEYEPTRPKLIRRDGYGWMEYVEATRSWRPEDVSKWFAAAGTLLFAAHVLRASDLHFDNVLVGDESPVLIDLETLMHPEPAADQAADVGSTAAARVARWMRSSFQSTGMLSFLQEGPDGAVIDIGGLCGTGGHELADGAFRWDRLSRDGLRKISRPARAKVRRNVPLSDGEPVQIGDHIAELQAGFSAAYRLVLSRREDLLGPAGVRAWFRGAGTRILLRPTEQYARVIQLLLRPGCQRDGATIGLAIEALNRGVLRIGPKPAQWDVVAWEREDLERLDIPRLTAPIDADVLTDPLGRPVPGVIGTSGWTAFEERVDSLSEDDLDRQLGLMALSLESSPEADEHVVLADDGEAPATATDRGESISSGSLKDVAQDIAEELLVRAVEGEDRSLIWLDRAHLRPAGRRDRGVSYYLYSGSVGIALFFAAMHRIEPDPRYRRAVAGALRPINEVLGASDVGELLADEGIGACHGLGGIVYALTLIADLLDEAEHLESARRMTAQITRDRIVSDGALDVEGGAAGAILGLMALHARTGDEDALETASACGRHLLGRQQPGPVDGAAWTSRQGGMLAGFAHGACGGAVALVRLWRATDDPRFLEAARRAIDFENTLYDPASGNWPLRLLDDQGRQSESRNMVAWCHGAPGIALARAGARDVLPEVDATGALEGALETTLAASAAGPDHLCCGTLGRVDTLLTVGILLGRADLRQAAETRAAMVMGLASSRGGFRFGNANRPARAGFFRGLAGVGYQLLRLCRPEVVPSVLAFHTTSLDGDRP